MRSFIRLRLAYLFCHLGQPFAKSAIMGSTDCTFAIMPHHADMLSAVTSLLYVIIFIFPAKYVLFTKRKLLLKQIDDTRECFLNRIMYLFLKSEKSGENKMNDKKEVHQKS